MAKPSEELVIEVEAGIADPPFIAIPRGQVLAPMSVGRRGMWRIEGSGVHDVHGYIYFDGRTFFLQSADEQRPIVAHGQPIGHAWTSVSPPCKIEMGTARLQFRATYTEDPLDDQATEVVDRPPISDPRPFKPGAFARQTSDSASTRVQPLEATGSGARGASSVPPPPPPPPRRRPIEEIPTTAKAVRPPSYDETMRMLPAPGTDLVGGAPMPDTRRPPPFVPTPFGSRPLPPPPRMPSGPPQMGFPPSADAPKAAPGINPHLEHLKEKWNELSGPKKILVALIPALTVSLYFLFIADDELPARPVATLDAGGAVAIPSGLPLADAAIAVPPTSTVPPTVSVSQLPTAPPPPTVPMPVPVPAPTAAIPGQRTLERQAVDYVASGQYERAAAAYDQLAQQYPDRPAYREAARILRGKLDAGVPPPP
jgi:hypothetical protein